MKSYLLVLIVFLLAACSKPAEMPVEQTEDSTPPITAAESGKEPASEATSQTSNDVGARVAAAQARMMASPAGKVIWESMEAHGGLANWYEGKNLTFRFNYMPVGGKKPNDTTQTIDLWSSRARHTLTSNPEVSFGWDGKQAWVSPADAEVGTNPRFWSLTPYYFVGVPFVLGDQGVKLAMEAPIEFEGKTYDTVRVTFEDGTGDASDYYVVYFDQQTRKVGGLRYVVTYKGFFPDGGHSPEKFMSYDGEQDIEGIKLPVSFRTFAWDGAKEGEVVTNTTLSDVAFQPDFSDFEVPKDARVVEGY
jgi:hypothetical protein